MEQLTKLEYCDKPHIARTNCSPFHTLIAIVSGTANAYALTKSICDAMGIKFKHTPNSQALHKNAMYLCNHRSWGDFFMDQTICNGGAYLSRLLVILGCPMSSLYAYLTHATWFFNRKKGIDREALGNYIQTQWMARPSKGLIVYPEGTRNLVMEPLRLKTGVLKMAYDYQRPVQTVVTTNKELVANEKDMQMQRNVECITSISVVIKPEDFKTFEEFVEAVREQFVETWKDAYGCDPKEAISYLPPFGLSKPEFEPVPYSRRIWYARIIVVLFSLMLYASRK